MTPEITVRPRERSADASIDHDDAYASLDPEDLGEHALRSATQSGWPAADSDAFSLGAAPASAAPAYPATAGVSNQELWAATLELAEEFGAWVDARGGNDDDAFDALWSRDVEASLFDAGSEEPVYETRGRRAAGAR